jgi:hypothetical protein
MTRECAGVSTEVSLWFVEVRSNSTYRRGASRSLMALRDLCSRLRFMISFSFILLDERSEVGVLDADAVPATCLMSAEHLYDATFIRSHEYT